MDDKIKIELRPYEALSIMCFLKEFNYSHPQLQALSNSVDAFEKEIYLKVSSDHVKIAEAEREVDILLGKNPER